MYHHQINRTIAEGHVAEMQRAAARTRLAAPVRVRRRRRAIAATLIAICALPPTADAIAQPVDSVAAKWRAHDEKIASMPSEKRSGAFGAGVRAARVGDTPADFPNASRAPEYDGPSVIEVVRPERTIVHDADQLLSITVAGLALVVALGGAVFTAIRSRGRSTAARTP